MPQLFNVALQLDRAREKRRLTSITHSAVVHEALAEFASRHAREFAWLAMPDHLHVLFSPFRQVKDADSLAGRIKQRINRGLSRRGRPKLHWREGIVLHAVDWQGAAAARDYILLNPVRGLLVERAEQWPHRGTPAPLP
jgi:REP element-mobilizing transposase RayT